VRKAARGHVRRNEHVERGDYSGKTTQDLIEQHVQQRRIPFRRIDGSSSLPARNKILEEFRRDRNIRILMMTTGTGAVW
jgi:SNF2 family DNA or RNA helicase